MVEGTPFLCFVEHLMRPAKEHHRAVVEGMMEARAGEDDPIEKTDREAHGSAVADPLDRAARPRTVPVHERTLAPIGGGGNEGLAVDDIADMGDKTRIEDRSDGLEIVTAPLVEPTQPRAGVGARRCGAMLTSDAVTPSSPRRNRG